MGNNMTFKQYFNENKEALQDSYSEYVIESKQMGIKPMTLKSWAKKSMVLDFE